MSIDTYRTISAEGNAIYREKMSRFIAFAYHVETANDVDACLAKIRREYHDARHICWAYSLGIDTVVEYSNDNGEPSGTAGKPILGQIKSLELFNVLVVVVRYFGGIKLGTSGLISAYRTAAREALESVEIVERRVRKRVSFTFPYLAMNDVMRLTKALNDVTVVEQQFDNSCSMTLEINRVDYDALESRLTDIDGVTLLTFI